jgi:hypothetical protein
MEIGQLSTHDTSQLTSSVASEAFAATEIAGRVLHCDWVTPALTGEGQPMQPAFVPRLTNFTPEISRGTFRLFGELREGDLGFASLLSSLRLGSGHFRCPRKQGDNPFVCQLTNFVYSARTVSGSLSLTLTAVACRGEVVIA